MFPVWTSDTHGTVRLAALTINRVAFNGGLLRQSGNCQNTTFVSARSRALNLQILTDRSKTCAYHASLHQCGVDLGEPK